MAVLLLLVVGCSALHSALIPPAADAYQLATTAAWASKAHSDESAPRVGWLLALWIGCLLRTSNYAAHGQHEQVWQTNPVQPMHPARSCCTGVVPACPPKDCLTVLAGSVPDGAAIIARMDTGTCGSADRWRRPPPPRTSPP